ncbi:hypothetical protein [Candidatus Solirubrobacter pratensis]|uniref:hypothetical protein n=1 Tax=Candidatus Solirubrobacter pratensis TaxID=1298857 RepID=UPI00041E15F3|nr:hypothetical protein [Candidatus Solirubrobacter pratensis]
MRTGAAVAAEPAGGPVVAGAPSRGRRLALPAVLWLAGALISGFTLRRYLGPLDEGILMQAATRMGGGQWPWRDFSWAYGPGEPLVVMAAGKLLGPSLLWWRLLRVAADATAALLIWALVRGERPRWALAAWAAAAVTAAQPTSANPAGPALAFALAAVLLASRRQAAWAGAAAAAAAFWRPDMGAAAGLAAAATAALAAGGGGAPRRAARAGLVALAAAVLAGAVLYAPFAIASGPARVWDALVVQGTRDGEWWRLPFPAGFDGSDPLDFLRWLLPYAALAAVIAAAITARRPKLVGLLVLALGATAYLLSRADEEHAQTLLVIAAAIAALATKPKPLFAAVLALLLVTGAGSRASALLRPPDLAPLHVEGAGGARVPPADARDLPRLVAYTQRMVPPGEPIYVAPARSDLVPFNDPLLHFLTRRPNVLHRDFLLQAKPEEQRRIVAALRRARPKVVIRWLEPPVREPNRRGRPTGDRALDAYLARAYRPAARFGDYLVLAPR